MLGLPASGDVAMAAPDGDVDPVPVEGGEGVFQPDSELADHPIRVGQLLLILVLGEMLVPEPTAPVADVPTPFVVLADLRLACPGRSAGARSALLSASNSPTVPIDAVPDSATITTETMNRIVGARALGSATMAGPARMLSDRTLTVRPTRVLRCW